MELLQLNMWQGRLATQITDLIDERKPDFITAQEIFKGGDTVLLPEKMFDLYDRIAERYKYHAFAAVNSIRVADSEVQAGTAIFSQYPIVEQSSFFTHGAFVEGLKVGHDIHNSRTLQSATIDVNGKALHLLTHHGHWIPNQFGNDESREKMQIIADYIRSLEQTDPIVFAGDLNVVAASPAMRPFDNLLTDLTAEYNIKTTLSSVRTLGDIACDHVLVNDAVKVGNFQVLEQIVSDHIPLVLEFEI